MTILPVRTRTFTYRGSKANKKAEVAEKNRNSNRISTYINRKLANSNGARNIRPDLSTYVISYFEISEATGLDIRFVQEAIRGGGGNGVTYSVLDSERHFLDEFKN